MGAVVVPPAAAGGRAARATHAQEQSLVAYTLHILERVRPRSPVVCRRVQTLHTLDIAKHTWADLLRQELHAFVG